MSEKTVSLEVAIEVVLRNGPTFETIAGLCKMAVEADRLAQRKPLTDVEIWNTYKNLWMFHPAEEPRLAGDVLKFARAIEQAHGIKDQWVGLTDNEIALINADYPHPQGFAKAIEAKLKEKNT